MVLKTDFPHCYVDFSTFSFSLLPFLSRCLCLFLSISALHWFTLSGRKETVVETKVAPFGLQQRLATK